MGATRVGVSFTGVESRSGREGEKFSAVAGRVDSRQS